MQTGHSKLEALCRSHLNRFVATYPAAIDPLRAEGLLELLLTSDLRLDGKVEAWAAGIIYALATDRLVRCGIPGVLNGEFTSLMGVSMETARRRAAPLRELLFESERLV